MIQKLSCSAIVFLLALLLWGCVNKSVNNPIQKQETTAPLHHTRDSVKVIINFPRPRGYVNDFEDLFTVNQERILGDILRHYDTARIVLVTVDMALFKPKPIEKFTLELFNRWGVGDSVTDNGILVCISQSGRIMRIENGYGIEKIVSDKQTKEIIDTAFLPFFRKGEYYEGVLSGINKIKKVVTAAVRDNEQQK